MCPKTFSAETEVERVETGSNVTLLFRSCAFGVALSSSDDFRGTSDGFSSTISIALGVTPVQSWGQCYDFKKHVRRNTNLRACHITAMYFVQKIDRGIGFQEKRQILGQIAKNNGHKMDPQETIFMNFLRAKF
jgi:hypothetical protein